MRKLEAIIKSWILEKHSFGKAKVFELDGEYYLYRYSQYLDGPVYMAMVQCYNIFGLRIEEIVLDSHNFEPFIKNRDNVKEFIMRHEIAHIKLGHYKLDVYNMSSEERLQLEMDADAYAANKVGYITAYESIKSLENWFNVLYDSYDNATEPRLEALKMMI